jgi:hypothetical protein
MAISDWLGFTLTSLSILAIIGVGVRWIIRHYLKDILHEIKPNGGSSIKDQVNRLEKDILALKKESSDIKKTHEKLDEKISHLTDIFIEYVSRQK